MRRKRACRRRRLTLTALVESLSPLALLSSGEGIERHATVGDVCFEFFKRHQNLLCYLLSMKIVKNKLFMTSQE